MAIVIVLMRLNSQSSTIGFPHPFFSVPNSDPTKCGRSPSIHFNAGQTAILEHEPDVLLSFHFSLCALIYIKVVLDLDAKASILDILERHSNPQRP